VATFRHHVFIARPVEAVFRAVADVHTHAQWQEGLLRTETDGDQQRAGARGVEVRRLFGRTARFPYEISVYEPERRWGFRALEGAIRPAAVLSFNRERDGTRIDSELTIPGVLGFIVGPVMLRQQRRNYVRLKALLESA
jgi:uncharacterized protein YndB with AHSA1/START domain